jgi:hypothetical protein
MKGICFNCKQEGDVERVLYHSGDLIEWTLQFCPKCLKELSCYLEPLEEYSE